MHVAHWDQQRKRIFHVGLWAVLGWPYNMSEGTSLSTYARRTKDQLPSSNHFRSRSGQVKKRCSHSTPSCVYAFKDPTLIVSTIVKTSRRQAKFTESILYRTKEAKAKNRVYLNRDWRSDDQIMRNYIPLRMACGSQKWRREHVDRLKLGKFMLFEHIFCPDVCPFGIFARRWCQRSGGRQNQLWKPGQCQVSAPMQARRKTHVGREWDDWKTHCTWWNRRLVRVLLVYQWGWGEVCGFRLEGRHGTIPPWEDTKGFCWKLYAFARLHQQWNLWWCFVRPLNCRQPFQRLPLSCLEEGQQLNALR